MTQLLFDLCGLAAALASTPGKAVWEVCVSECSIALRSVWSLVYAQKLINTEKALFAPAGLRLGAALQLSGLSSGSQKFCNYREYFMYFPDCSGIINCCSGHKSICHVKIFQALGFFLLFPSFFSL